MRSRVLNVIQTFRGYSFFITGLKATEKRRVQRNAKQQQQKQKKQKLQRLQRILYLGGLNVELSFI